MISLREELRLQSTALRTEKTYVHWVRDFYRHVQDKSPSRVDDADVRSYLTELTLRRGVALSTQKQARKPQRLPLVLTRDEISRLFAHLSGRHLLMRRLISGVRRLFEEDGAL